MRSPAILIALLSLATALTAAEPFAGTWKLDPGRSTGSIPKDETVVIRQEGARLAVEISIVLPDNRALTIRYSTPVNGGMGHIDEGPYNGVLLTRHGRNSMETTYLTDGKKVRFTRAVIASDGSTMTSTGRPLDGAEQAGWTMVFRKQPAR